MHRIRWSAVAALATFAVLTAACSDDGTNDQVSPAATTASTSAGSSAADGTVRAVISNFTLPSLTVKAGTVVEFVNEDSTGHTATSEDKTTFDSKTLAPGTGTFKFTASKAGTFPYACSIHPSMKASITVQ